MTTSSNKQEFGSLHGECIENKDTILSQIDIALRCDPPDIEFIFAESVIKSNNGILNKMTTFLGRFGHSAIRYKFYPDSNNDNYQDIVMNIVGNKVENTKMVNFISTKEYLFGTDKFDRECEQSGIYNRTFYGIRIQKVSRAQLRALHYQFKTLQYREEANTSSFKLFGGRSKGFIWKYIPFESDINDGIIVSNSGNCSMWTSCGLVAAGLIPRKRIFPKAIFVELYQRQMRINPDNIKIVKYEEIAHCYKYWKGYKTVNSLVNPLLPVLSLRFWNLDKLCNVIVRVQKNTKRAIIVKQNNYQRISVNFWWRNLNTIFTIFVTFYILLFSLNSNESKIIIVTLWVLMHYWIY